MIGPFRLYQVLLIIVAIISLSFIYHRLRHKKTTPATFALWIIGWIVVLFFAFKPKISDPLAGMFGFGRGIDLLLIVGLLISLYMNCFYQSLCDFSFCCLSYERMINVRENHAKI